MGIPWLRDNGVGTDKPPQRGGVVPCSHVVEAGLGIQLRPGELEGGVEALCLVLAQLSEGGVLQALPDVPRGIGEEMGGAQVIGVIEDDPLVRPVRGMGSILESPTVNKRLDPFTPLL